MVRGLKPEEWGIPVIFTSRVIKPIMLKAPVVHEKWGIREVKHIGRLKVLTSNQTIKKIIQNHTKWILCMWSEDLYKELWTKWDSSSACWFINDHLDDVVTDNLSICLFCKLDTRLNLLPHHLLGDHDYFHLYMLMKYDEVPGHGWAHHYLYQPAGVCGTNQESLFEPQNQMSWTEVVKCTVY